MDFNQETEEARGNLADSLGVTREALDHFVDHALRVASPDHPVELNSGHPLLGRYRRVIRIVMRDGHTYVQIEGERGYPPTLYVVAEKGRVEFVDTKRR